VETINLVGGNPKSEAISLNVKVFFFFCFNVETLIKFMATTNMEMEIYETQHVVVQPKSRLI
jgi:hypothetical protein